EFIPAHVRILFADFGNPFVPPGHGNRNAVGLGGSSQVLAALLRKFVGELQDALGADTGKDAFLDNDFALGALEQDAAAVGVFTLGVFAHDEKIDIAGLAIS